MKQTDIYIFHSGEAEAEYYLSLPGDRSMSARDVESYKGRKLNWIALCGPQSETAPQRLKRDGHGNWLPVPEPTTPVFTDLWKNHSPNS